VRSPAASGAVAFLILPGHSSQLPVSQKPQGESPVFIQRLYTRYGDNSSNPSRYPQRAGTHVIEDENRGPPCQRGF
jgi:hypothetical protein